VVLLADRPRTLRLVPPLAVGGSLAVVHRQVRLATRVAAVEAAAIVRDRYSPELTEGLDGEVSIRPFFFLLDDKSESFCLARAKSVRWPSAHSGCFPLF
jgi:hypothetical protein